MISGPIVTDHCGFFLGSRGLPHLVERPRRSSSRNHPESIRRQSLPRRRTRKPGKYDLDQLGHTAIRLYLWSAAHGKQGLGRLFRPPGAGTLQSHAPKGWRSQNRICYMGLSTSLNRVLPVARRIWSHDAVRGVGAKRKWNPRLFRGRQLAMHPSRMENDCNDDEAAAGLCIN